MLDTILWIMQVPQLENYETNGKCIEGFKHIMLERCHLVNNKLLFFFKAFSIKSFKHSSQSHHICPESDLRTKKTQNRKENKIKESKNLSETKKTCYPFPNLETNIVLNVKEFRHQQRYNKN